MQNIFQQLIALLKKDKRLISQDGELLKNQIQELARKNDPELIKLLLSDKAIKQLFFFEVEKTLIFDKEKFIRFISNKQFLPDSYTAFKNKIGLTTGDEYVSENKEVVLAWPYKDCILEGGMTKEDQKRDEIFYNEILAPDDINRLLDAKVFTNFKRIDKNGEHKMGSFRRDEKGTIKDNLIIKGNNLLALASLKKEFAGKVKLIYIDPPFNTGGDSFNYNDRFNHSSWLVFMKNRLEIAKQLLSDTGSIFIQCDENESHYLKIICDEIFDRENLMNEIIWRYRTYQGQVKDYFPKKHDTIFWYIKRNRPKFTLSYQNNKEDTVDFKRWEEFINKDGQIVFPNYPKTDSRFTAYLNKWTKQNGIPQEGDVIYDIKGYVVDDVWEDIKALDAKNKSERTGFKGGQKPEELLQRIIQSVTVVGDIVLDYHLGSGTTAAVAQKMDRQYIGIEQLNYGKNDSVVRLKKVIAGEQGGISEAMSWKGGGDFVYMELAKWNEEWIEKIEKAKTGKEFAKLWDEMKETAFLSYKVDTKTVDANAKDFADLSVIDQKNFLIECLDKNQLYVNVSEIDDKEYGVSKEDIKLNREFYK
jgi:adenine-specific DNA-methyltransferase